MPELGTTVVVGAAPDPGGDAFYRRLLERASLVVAADAAGEWCASLGVQPHVAIGDFDSALPGAVVRLRAAGTEVLEYPADKDESDLALAVAEARRRTSAPIVLTAASTARLDHTLATLGELIRAPEGSALVEPSFSAIVVTGPAARSLADVCAPGATVSLLAPGGATGVTLDGCRWPLRDATLESLDSLGVSNVVTGSNPRISVRQGSVLVVTVQLS